MELKQIIRSVIQGKYVFGCKNPILKNYCKPKGCPFVKKEEKEAEKKRNILLFTQL